MLQLIAAFSHLVMRSQNTIHRAPVAEVAALVEQRGIDLTRRLVLERLTVQHLSYLSSLLLAQGTRR